MANSKAAALAKVILEITDRVPGITRALLLYRFIQLLSFPFVFLYFAGRLLTDRSYWAHFRERLGFVPQPSSRTSQNAIWLHAVSAGEVSSCIPLMEQFRCDAPGVPIYLSTSTLAGRKTALHKASGLADAIFYSPLDYLSFVRRVLRNIRPALVVVLETEIWPNLYSEIKRSGARLVVANGRISNRSWPRYQTLKTFFAPVLHLPDLILTQSATDCERYIQLGCPTEKADDAGNLKYDTFVTPDTPDLPTFGAEQIWIAASTAGPNERGSVSRHSIDEDEVVIESFKTLAAEFPRLFLILAPRQPGRFGVVAEKLERSGIAFLRRSTMKAEQTFDLALPGVLLLDTIGELSGVYSLGDVAFIGGSIAPRGGHNIIEPAAAGVPVIVGPHMENFEAIALDFLGAQAMVQIQDAGELAPAVRDLLVNRERAKALGARARQLVRSKRGASRAIARRIWPLYYSAYPRPLRNLMSRAILAGLGFLWRKGGVLKRRRFRHYADAMAPLPAPVVSVGGITVGGSGKTPFTTYLAGQLKERGYSPAILTRGYRRRSPAQDLVFAAGSKVPRAFTGDEAQIFLRSGIAPVGIGRNRYEAAEILLQQFPATDVLLLDDGFQHARIKRDFDLVLIDGLDPFGHENTVPEGRLREPLDALSRATAFAVTRAENDLRFEAISQRLGEYNPSAPVFRTRLKTRCWRDHRTGACTASVDAQRVAAFCGVGNPQNFWMTLESMGLDLVFRWSFEDHHVYKPFELQRIAHQARVHGAEILVTTEKDRINCPSTLAAAIAPLDLYWLEIELQVENEPKFFALLERALSTAASCASNRFLRPMPPVKPPSLPPEASTR